MHLRSLLAFVLATTAVGGARTAGAADRTFAAGSLVIPMDLTYQSTGMFQAYGLIYQLLREGVHVHWIIDPAKSWHAAPCNTPGDECAWACAAGSAAKCPYPTASPDVTIATKVIWDDKAVVPRDTALGAHGYRGGPFVIDAADRDKALAIIDVWNDKTKWSGNPWAMRTVFHVTSVHEATAGFTGNSSRELFAPPTIAVFSDGNESIATGYLRAAGIPQSNGSEFPSGNCNGSTCGPGTANPDMLTPEAIAGDLGTCNAPNYNHKNGALFKPDGTPAYCQIMSMHWGVNQRERVECEGGCPATQAECQGERFTFNGHEVVAEVRAFLAYPTHFFAECQAVNAYENTVPNPNWPYLDDEGRDGHFLTTIGTPPLCPAGACTDANYECVQGACSGQACCLPKPGTWQTMPGYEVAQQPATAEVKVLRPEVPYNQFDGAFGTTGGSEPAYNLSTYLGSTYKNNRQVTLLTGANGPGSQDLWMSGYLDGCGDIILKPERQRSELQECEGKISYLGGHAYSTNVPVASGSQSQGTRLFLNALFEAQCAALPVGEDSDGDGVDDENDPFPDDPTRCGDANSDGCDDCDVTCNGDGGPNPTSGDSGGCCGTGSGPAGSLLLTGLAVLIGRRRRVR
jgi:hypothetical protein